MKDVAGYWDAAAGTFDEEADHGLRDPIVRAAWAAQLTAWLPVSPSAVLDLGCGTGSLSHIVALAGHRVLGVDLSPEMVTRAREKLIGTEARVLIGNAADPPVGPMRFDVVLVRHLLWTLPDPVAALARWTNLLRPGGRLILIEGRWNTPAQPSPTAEENSAGPGYVPGTFPWMGGVRADTLAAALRPLVSDLRVEQLNDATLWGKTINDERYAVIAKINKKPA